MVIRSMIQVESSRKKDNRAEQNSNSIERCRDTTVATSIITIPN